MRKIVWPLALFIIAWVLGAYLGIALKSVVTPIYNLLSGRTWIIVAEVIAIAFLLCLIDGARRVHKRTVDELKKQQSAELATLETQRLSALRDSDKRVLTASTLSKHVAMLEEHFAFLASQKPLDKEFLEAWLYGVECSINQWLGPDAAPDAIKAFYDVGNATQTPPDTLDDRIVWARKYISNLNRLITDQVISC